ncbi:MAG: helix-turn-helix domain-containing protein [Planctomycetes bacterium]|nr:helix-turn-helix domain-containing protein [Planctomycetota bacterium]
MGLSRAAVFHKVARREIPFVRVGKRALRFDREALDRWIRSRTVRALPKSTDVDAAPVACHDTGDGSRQAPA